MCRVVRPSLVRNGGRREPVADVVAAPCSAAEALWTGNAAPARPPSAAANTRNKEKKQGAVEGDEPRTWFDAAGRMLHWRELLVARGIAAEALMPRWCSQRDPYACYVDAGVPQ
jgi:hypothetical protein